MKDEYSMLVAWYESEVAQPAYVVNMPGNILEFPIRNRNLFSPEINCEVLSNGELNRILIAAIQALPHVNDLTRREELKRALCELLLDEHGVA
jgi:hypothetical protein